VAERRKSDCEDSPAAAVVVGQVALVLAPDGLLYEQRRDGRSSLWTAD